MRVYAHFCHFPNGRVVPRAMWVVLAVWGLYALLDSLSTYAATQALVSDALANIAWPMMFLSGIAAQLYRYKRVSTAAEREQTKWVVLGLAALVIFVLLTFTVFAPDASYFQGVSIHRLSFQILTISVAFLLIPGPHRHFDFALSFVGHRRHHPQDTGLFRVDGAVGADLFRRRGAGAATHPIDHRRHRIWRLPSRHWSSRRCSSRCGGACRTPSIDGSIGASMTRPRPSPRLARRCAMRSSWRS